MITHRKTFAVVKAKIQIDYNEAQDTYSVKPGRDPLVWWELDRNELEQLTAAGLTALQKNRGTDV